MRSIDRLALGSLILGCVAFTLGCLYIEASILAIFYVAELGDDTGGLLFTTWIGATFGAVNLGVAALSKRAVRSGGRRGRAQGWIGIAFVVCILPQSQTTAGEHISDLDKRRLTEILARKQGLLVRAREIA